MLDFNSAACSKPTPSLKTAAIQGPLLSFLLWPLHHFPMRALITTELSARKMEEGQAKLEGGRGNQKAYR